jgi:branched-chain amino acid transport system permease protein
LLDPQIVFAALLNGLTQGAVYALVALGLTLIYGVLHIINFAHGALLMAALYGFARLGGSILRGAAVMAPAMFALGYGLQRFVVGRAAHGRDENVLLVTLGLAIVLENAALAAFKSDTRTIETAYTFSTVSVAGAMIAVPKVVAFFGALVVAALMLLLVSRTDLGRAIRAVAKEPQGARLVGIDVEHVFAMSFGIGLACLGAAACFLLPAYYVNPRWATASC